MARTAQRAAGREAVIAAVAAQALAETPPAGRVLVAGDLDGAAVRALRDQGAAVTDWRRLALGGYPATPWPPDGLFEAAVLRLPRGRAALAMDLHAVAARLAPGAPVWLYGGNEEGIASAAGHLDGLLDAVDTLSIRRRARVLRARRTAAPARGALEDWRDLTADGLVSFPGLFAHGRLDPGTALLLGALPDPSPDARVLDFGCGAGAVAHAVRLRCPSARLTLLDVDALALAAAAHNVPHAEVALSDGWGAARALGTFDLILSNPPIHRGVEEDFSIVGALIAGAPERLRPGGRLVAVVQRTAGVGKLFAAAFPSVETLAETTQYQVWSGRVAGR